jgi:hypothetical protein
VDQQATGRPRIQSGATIYRGRLKGSQGVTPFPKVTGPAQWRQAYKTRAN